MKHTGLIALVAVLVAAGTLAQTAAREQLARGQALWDQRLAKSATAALEAAAKDPSTAAEAHEALGRMYTFRGWQADNVYPGWHDEPSLREKALAELRAAVAADPNRASAREALRLAEGFAAAESVDPAPPRRLELHRSFFFRRHRHILSRDARRGIRHASSVAVRSAVSGSRRLAPPRRSRRRRTRPTRRRSPRREKGDTRAGSRSRPASRGDRSARGRCRGC